MSNHTLETVVLLGIEMPKSLYGVSGSWWGKYHLDSKLFFSHICISEVNKFYLGKMRLLNIKY